MHLCVRMCAYIHGVAGSAAAIWSWGEQRVTSPLLVTPPTFLSCPVSTSVRHPMAWSRVPAPPTLLIHVGSRRSANHRTSCRRCCDSSLVNHSVSFWPCTRFGVRLGKVVGSWRLLVLEKKNHEEARCILSNFYYFWGLFKRLRRTDGRCPRSWTR